MRISSALLLVAGGLGCVAPGCSGHVTAPGDGVGSSGNTGASTGGRAHGGSESQGLSGEANQTGGSGPSGGFAGAIGDAGGGGAPPQPQPAPYGGSAGDDELSGDSGFGGVANDSCNDEAGNGCIIEYGSDISALSADDSSVYWVEHGSADALGNYQNDGRLFKRAFGTATRQLLASNLSGPVGVALTSAHYFVYLDQAWDADGPDALARIPITGGSAEIVQRGAEPTNARGDACPGCFVQSGSTAYFPLSDGIYAISAGAATPTQMTTMKALSLTVAGAYLYFEGGADFATSDQIWRLPLAGGTPERVASLARSSIRASGTYLYALEPGGVSYLSRMPLAGAMWTRLPNEQHGVAAQLNIVGGRFFYDIEQYDGPYQIDQGLLADPAAAPRILSVPRKQNVKAWVGTAAGLFWTDGHTLRLQSNAL